MSKKTTNFESAINQLEELVSELETGELPLEEALKAFESGVKITRKCQQQLDQAQQRVDLLVEQDGELNTTAFDSDGR